MIDKPDPKSPQVAQEWCTMRIHSKHIVMVAAALLIFQAIFLGTLEVMWLGRGRPKEPILIAQTCLCLILGVGVLRVKKEQGITYWKSPAFCFTLCVFVVFCLILVLMLLPK
jgi:hypothetical protein